MTKTETYLGFANGDYPASIYIVQWRDEQGTIVREKAYARNSILGNHEIDLNVVRQNRKVVLL